jgi:hypothetical protein
MAERRKVENAQLEAMVVECVEKVSVESQEANREAREGSEDERKFRGVVCLRKTFPSSDKSRGGHESSQRGQREAQRGSKPQSE